jgi:purine-binding chemotaxis protein CheW
VKASSTFYLTFRAAGSRFAVPVDAVQEAARIRSIAPLPGAPPEYLGVALIRGEPVGVIDVGQALAGRPRATSTGLTPTVVVLEGRAHALLVDRIDGVEEFTPERLLPAPPGAPRLAGAVSEGERFLSILDVDALLAKGVP